MILYCERKAVFTGKEPRWAFSKVKLPLSLFPNLDTSSFLPRSLYDMPPSTFSYGFSRFLSTTFLKSGHIARNPIAVLHF